MLRLSLNDFHQVISGCFLFFFFTDLWRMRLLLLVVLGLLLINGLESKRSGRDSDFDDNEFAEFEDFDEDEGNASTLETYAHNTNA